MSVTYALLSLNLVLVTLCLFRTTHRERPSLDALLRQARLTPIASPVQAQPGRIVPFRTRAELEVAQARGMHPSSGHPSLNSL